MRLCYPGRCLLNCLNEGGREIEHDVHADGSLEENRREGDHEIMLPW